MDDDRLVLIFASEADARAAQAVIDGIARAWWTEQGYIVDAGGVVPKRAKDGANRPDAARTRTWAEPRQSVTGDWWLPSLTGERDEWAAWKDRYAEASGPAFTEQARPAEWDQLPN